MAGLEPEDVRLYSIPSVAKQLDASRSTVYRLINSRALLAVELEVSGKKCKRVRSDALAAYIESLRAA